MNGDAEVNPVRLRNAEDRMSKNPWLKLVVGSKALIDTKCVQLPEQSSVEYRTDREEFLAYTKSSVHNSFFSHQVAA